MPVIALSKSLAFMIRSLNLSFGRMAYLPGFSMAPLMDTSFLIKELISEITTSSPFRRI